LHSHSLAAVELILTERFILATTSLNGSTSPKLVSTGEVWRSQTVSLNGLLDHEEDCEDQTLELSFTPYMSLLQITAHAQACCCLCHRQGVAQPGNVPPRPAGL